MGPETVVRTRVTLSCRKLARLVAHPRIWKVAVERAWERRTWLEVKEARGGRGAGEGNSGSIHHYLLIEKKKNGG